MCKERLLNERVISEDKREFFEVIQNSDQSFSLKKYIVRYDEEESVEYSVEQQPHPTSRFKDIEAAVEEAKRLLK